MDHLDAMSPSVKILSIILLSFIGCCMVLCCIGYFIHRKQMRQRKRSQISPELRVPESIFAIQISDGPIMEVDHIPTYDNYSFEKPPPSYESVSRSASVSSYSIPPPPPVLSTPPTSPTHGHQLN